ncbi:MAG: hypothetical protein NC223_02985 [Butyrivibrio sp.]|nr:hypothetical protein [Butyrivibrio sp.]
MFPKNRKKNGPQTKSGIKFFDEVSEFVGYRYEATGVWAYNFYKGKEKICSVSSIVAPSSPIMIYGFGYSWKSELGDSTAASEHTRYVCDCSDDRKLYKIIYKGNGKYEINDSLLVYCDAERYSFFCDNRLIAEINRIADKSDFELLSTAYDAEPYFDIFTQDRMDEQLLMLIFSFPMLRFDTDIVLICS